MDVADEHSAVNSLARAPETPGGQFEHKRIFKTGEFSLAREQRRDLTTQPARRVPVVIVPVRDDSAARFLAGSISLFANRSARRQPHVTRLWSPFDKIAHRIITIVDDDQFSGGIVLRIERLERKAAGSCRRLNVGIMHETSGNSVRREVCVDAAAKAGHS